MADSTAFSGPGSANTEARSGTKVELPEFFVKSSAPEDEVSMETVETPREQAARIDAVEGIGKQTGAPKL